MKSLKLTLPVLLMLSFAFVLAGCPSKGKMMGQQKNASQIQQVG